MATGKLLPSCPASPFSSSIRSSVGFSEKVQFPPLHPTLADCQFSKVNRIQIREVIAAKKAEGDEQSTIRNIMAPIRGMFFHSMEDGILDKNPATRIGKLNRAPKDKPQKKINPLSRGEIQVLLKTALEKRPTGIPCSYALAGPGSAWAS